MARLKTIAWNVKSEDGAAPITKSFDVYANVKETLVKLGKKFDAAQNPLSTGLSNVEHVKLLERGINELQSDFVDANDPTPEERNARAQLIAEIGVNTSQSRQTFESDDNKLLAKAEGQRKRGVDAMAILD